MSALTHRRLLPALRLSGGGLLTALVDLDAAWRSRRALGRLCEDRLADVGLSRADARTHAERPAWDAPANWLR